VNHRYIEFAWAEIDQDNPAYLHFSGHQSLRESCMMAGTESYVVELKALALIPDYRLCSKATKGSYTGRKLKVLNTGLHYQRMEEFGSVYDSGSLQWHPSHKNPRFAEYLGIPLPLTPPSKSPIESAKHITSAPEKSIGNQSTGLRDWEESFVEPISFWSWIWRKVVGCLPIGFVYTFQPSKSLPKITQPV
jgi:hypothetical protein